MRDEQILLDISRLYKSYHMGRQELHAVCSVDLSVRKGESFGIVGESGCGKSTLAQMVIGALQPTAGKIKVNGIDYWALKRKEKPAFRRKVQMVFQDPASSFSPRMKIGPYLMEPMRNYDRMPKKEAEKKTAAFLEMVGLPAEFMRRYPHELSGGQLQRVVIARALAAEPALLVCDEATGALDVSVQDQIVRLLVRLQEEQGVTTLFIGHDLALVKSMTQRIGVMYLGRLTEIVSSETLEEKGSHPYTRALLGSVMDVYCDQSRSLPLLEGEPPSPLKLPAGCPFAGRCHARADVCLRQQPELTERETGHFVACHMV